MSRPFILLSTLALAAISMAIAPVVLCAEPVRLATTAFGTSAEIEIRDLPRAEAETAARAALQEIFEISQLSDPESETEGGVGMLNAAVGSGPQPLAAQAAELLLRSLQICVWSSGAHGPLGGELYRVWNGDSKVRIPNTEDLRSAVISASCSQLGLAGGEPPTGELLTGSRLDLSWLARGFAIDRAVEKLEEHGVSNAWLEIGPVYRAVGPGPGGLGWLLDLPPAPGSKDPIDRLWLMDQALTIVTKEPGDDEVGPALIDQRTGVPPRGVVTVIVVASQAWDAEALAASLFVLGLRDGQLRLGGYSPRPSIFWLLGEGNGTPLQSTYRWSELRRMPKR